MRRDDPRTTAGDDIRLVREFLGETQTQFAARFEMSKRTMIRWEAGGHHFSEYRWQGSWGFWSRRLGRSEGAEWVRATDAACSKLRRLLGVVQPRAAKPSRR